MHCLGPSLIFPCLVNGGVYKILFKFIFLFQRFIAIIFMLFSINRNFIIIICLILEIVNTYIVVDKELLNNRLIQLQIGTKMYLNVAWWKEGWIKINH
jgi:hypothetical protein